MSCKDVFGEVQYFMYSDYSSEEDVIRSLAEQTHMMDELVEIDIVKVKYHGTTYKVHDDECSVTIKMSAFDWGKNGNGEEESGWVMDFEEIECGMCNRWGDC